MIRVRDKVEFELVSPEKLLLSRPNSRLLVGISSVPERVGRKLRVSLSWVKLRPLRAVLPRRSTVVLNSRLMVTPSSLGVFFGSGACSISSVPGSSPHHGR